ncbi:MAG: hypothetical protein AAF823_07130 [Planctomycetota bacterium]
MLELGGNTDLAPTVGALVRDGGVAVRAAIRGIAEAGLGHVQLDATLRGTRPRELDGRARKDLAAACTRAGLAMAGLDCFVPARHLEPGADVDRATAALLGAVGLAADLGRLCVSFAVPAMEAVDRDALGAVVEAADGHGVTLAVHGEQDAATRAWVAELGSPTVRLGVDAASVLVAGGDVAAEATAEIGSLRLADAARDRDGQWARCAVGSGEVDVTAAWLAAELTSRGGRAVVLDLSRVERAGDAMVAGAAAWREHAPRVL